MESAPFEVLSRLFSYLPSVDVLSCENVCKRWYGACQHYFKSQRAINLQNVLYSGQNPDQLTFKAKNKLLNQLLQRCTNLESLHLCSAPKERTTLNFTAKHELCITSMGIIFKNCKQLKSLDVSNHIFTNEVAFQFFVANLPEGLTDLVMNCCRLDVVHEDWTNRADDFNRMDHILCQLFRRLTKLEKLDLRGTCNGFFQVSATGLEYLPPSMKYLDISGGFAAKLSDLDFIKNLPNLNTLFLERCHIEQKHMEDLVRCCPTLENISLSYCHNVKNFGILTAFENLKTLVLDGNRDNVTDDSMSDLLKTCKGLQKLSLENCRLLTDDSLHGLANLSELKYLSLSSIPKLTGRTLDAICENCAHLEEMHLKFCKSLTTGALQSLTKLKNLRKLYINGVESFSQAILNVLVHDTSLDHCEALGCSGLALNCGLKKCRIALSA